jgi:hypothetical protein
MKFKYYLLLLIIQLENNRRDEAFNAAAQTRKEAIWFNPFKPFPPANPMNVYKRGKYIRSAFQGF